MSIKNAVSLPPIKIDQLLTMRGFTQHCLQDYIHDRKLEGVSEEFIKAAEADKFLEPILQAEGENLKEDGSKETVLVNYYSPHQIFIIAQLHNNKVNENGKLESKHSFDVRYSNRATGRAITWGWNGITFEIEHYKPSINEISIFEICRDFNNFLRLLHSLENSRYSSFDMRKERHFNDAPNLQIDFSPLKNNEEILSSYNLSIQKMKVLLGGVGNTATRLDPLEYWYNYLHRHPQWRKDLFKGEALLAQELYIICDLISDVIEVISGEKLPSLLEFLYGGNKIYPYLMPRTEYVRGTDIKSMWAAIEKFKKWMIEEGNKDFVDKDTIIKLENFEKRLREYENKYSDKYYISNGIREVEVEEAIKLEDLDPQTKQYVDQILTQAMKDRDVSKRQFLSLWDDELEEKVKNKKITLEQAKKEDYDMFIKREIFDAIERRLDDLRRELWGLFDIIHDLISKKADAAWNVERNFSNYFWFQNKDKFDKMSEKDRMELYQAEYKQAYDQAQFWSKKRDDFGSVQFEMELLYCSVCREKPVLERYSMNDQRLSRENICTECEGDTSALKEKRKGEWKCDFCGRMLYKFAYNNRLNDLVKNTATLDVQLLYGRMEIKVKCPNPRCNETNTRTIDWGWTE